MYDTITGNPPQPCGVCSNGSNLIYHLNGPCPYVYTPNMQIHWKHCPHCGGIL